MSMQIVPPFEPLLALLPSGREYHKPQEFVLPELDEDVLARMRAPPDPRDAADFVDDSESDVEREEPPGTFPGTQRDYVGSSSYY
jgi:hypothetical protein